MSSDQNLQLGKLGDRVAGSLIEYPLQVVVDDLLEGLPLLGRLFGAERLQFLLCNLFHLLIKLQSKQSSRHRYKLARGVQYLFAPILPVLLELARLFEQKELGVGCVALSLRHLVSGEEVDCFLGREVLTDVAILEESLLVPTRENVTLAAGWVQNLQFAFEFPVDLVGGLCVLPQELAC